MTPQPATFFWEINLAFIRKIAQEQYRSMVLDENDIVIDADNLVQEGSIGLLKDRVR